jgi:hypothetical protein
MTAETTRPNAIPESAAPTVRRMPVRTSGSTAAYASTPAIAKPNPPYTARTSERDVACSRVMPNGRISAAGAARAYTPMPAKKTPITAMTATATVASCPTS